MYQATGLHENSSVFNYNLLFVEMLFHKPYSSQHSHFMYTYPEYQPHICDRGNT